MKLDGKVEPKPGVYMIKNIVNGKLYIGSTVNMKNRVCQHRHEFKKGHSNVLLKHAYNKYGKACFVFNVLEYCEKRSIRTLEQIYICKFNTIDRKFGYNLTEVTETGLPILSDDARKRISIASRLRQNSRPAEEKQAWAKQLHVQRTPEERSKAAKKAAKKYWENKSADQRISIMRSVSEAAWEKTRKKVLCSNGIVYPSLSECSRSLGISVAAIHRLINKNGKSRKLNNLSFTWYQETSNETGS